MLHRQHRLVLAASLIFAAIPAMPWIGAAGMRIAVRADPERLTWSYFRRVDSMSGTSEHARIAAEMSFPQPLRIERAEGEYRLPQFTITVTPQPARTVARRSVALSPALLRHEQGHYDIVVLAARALARELEGLNAGSAQELTRRVEDCVSKHTARAERLSEAYDRATDHSHDPAEQARWTERIDRALADGEATRLEGLPL